MGQEVKRSLRRSRRRDPSFLTVLRKWQFLFHGVRPRAPAVIFRKQKKAAVRSSRGNGTQSNGRGIDRNDQSFNRFNPPPAVRPGKRSRNDCGSRRDGQVLNSGIPCGQLRVDLEVVPPEDHQHQQASQQDGSQGHAQHGDEDVALGSLNKDAGPAACCRRRGTGGLGGRARSAA